MNDGLAADQLSDERPAARPVEWPDLSEATDHELAAFTAETPFPLLCGWLEYLSRETGADSLRALRQGLTQVSGGTYDKHYVPRLVARALLLRGDEGVEVLADLVRDPDVPGHIYPQAILEALRDARTGRESSLIQTALGLCPSSALSRSLSVETVAAATRAVEDLFAEVAVDPGLFDRVLTAVGRDAQFGPLLGPVDRQDIMDLLTRATIKLSPSLLAAYSDLIDADVPEERYQEFFEQHPVFLDPLASRVIPKQRLGLEYATDFVIGRYDDSYVLVEIERPQTPVVTSRGDFTAPFTHAFGQVLDFQRWVEDNGAYAARHMPGIASPRGLLVVGRRAALSDDQALKLRRFCANSATIEVVTFDDVLVQARNLYENLRYRDGT